MSDARGQSRRAWMAALLSPACRGEDEAREVADAFVRSYYVGHRPDEALAHAAGAAKERLRDEVSQRGDVAPADVPVIETVFLGRDETGPERAVLAFELRIRPRGQDGFVRQARITVGVVDDRWLVIDFSED